MAPIRRYLRISKYTVLESRIYLENPSDIRWLLNARDAVLPRVFAAIRPLVLPKLREENERLFAKKKGKPVKDVISEEEFEVALFLRESRTRHSLLTRHKEFGEEEKGGYAVRRGWEESDEEEGLEMRDIPQASGDDDDDDDDDNGVGGKRQRDDADWQSDDSPERRRTLKRRKDDSTLSRDADDGGDKKMRFRTNYEGFNIYGWVLCLLVTRKGDKTGTRAAPAEPGRQVLMEEWISSQAQGDLPEE
ncbi:hypothetical protein BO83DRAFT_396383 [Aspergillus eucalypticola CBS 122712]|uniref:Uncharacterized protein n=1 Tax=Aspergillus eucalypticola (strain CBS 122712 / IBT 29274) TaxID=1448314 RepID=A0A317W093_ASPEC|nr:uncharacterized protein BO83DRAFT_396383 [Aspergillus eucalypticola CBS 122712]PWY79923.1 hypothetical protein BO83DRAFT_396383 [Aspergillus eucalypticola CBS 122712]